MSDFFKLLLSEEHSLSIFLYSLIFIISTLFASYSQKYQSLNGHKFSIVPFIASFLILWFFFAFNDVGIDTPHYRSYFDEYKSFSDTSTHYGAVEIGYQYLNIFIHFITDNSHIAIVIIRTLQLAVLFVSMYILRTKIHIGFAVMAFVALYYFQSFNLLRSSLAGSFCLLSFALFYKRKYFWSVLSAFLAFEFHRSAVFFGLSLFLYSLSYGSILRKYRKFLIIITIIAVLVFLRIGSDLITLFLMNDFGGGRYEEYLYNKGTSLGLFVLFQYFPVFVSLFMSRNNRDPDNMRWWNLCFVMAVIGFALAILAYSNGMLTRAAIYFSSSFIFLIPSYLHSLNTRGRRYKIYSLLIFVFYMIMFIITLGGLYKISGLGPFVLI